MQKVRARNGTRRTSRSWQAGSGCGYGSTGTPMPAELTNAGNDVCALLLAGVLGAGPGRILDGRRGRPEVSSSRRR